MNIPEIISVAIFFLGFFVEIAPIKISPLAWIGRRMNKDTNDKMDRLQWDLQEHIADDMRTYIIDFQNQCLNRRKHTKEEFLRAYRMCDKYEKYVKENGLKNSEADDAIAYIRKVYRHCLEGGDFLLKEA